MERKGVTDGLLRHRLTHLMPLSVRRLPFQAADKAAAARDTRRLATARPDVIAALGRVHDDPALRALYDRYVTDISNWEWAVSWPTVRVLDALCTALRPKKVLDLGSGFSTYVVCNWARRNGADTEVVSVDTSDEWLEKTRAFLTREGLQAQLIPARDIDSLPDRSFELAFDDIGRTEERANVIPTIIRVMAPGGVVVLDDMNVRGYRSEVRTQLVAAHWDLYSARPFTFDAKGRFAMLTAAPEK
jgi:predicted O-methyltransferase YrrM